MEPMKDNESQGALPAKRERIRLEGSYRVRFRFFAVFVICCGILLASFAVSSIWLEGGGKSWIVGLLSPPSDEGHDELNGALDGEVTHADSDSEQESGTDEEEVIPNGAIQIVTADLSAPSLGVKYIHNETRYIPDVDRLLSMDVSSSDLLDGPKVLILHTHTGESYLPSGTGYVEGIVGDVTHSRNEAENVISVGQVLCKALNERGITAIHCTVMHDDPTYSGSYARSAETVKKYLMQYPSIEYVIDLHRDSVMNSDGELIRTDSGITETPTAQVMAVVGTDGNGTPHSTWEKNLALALQLKAGLNEEAEALCRPVSLRNASYNQELAKYSLLLEIGSCANSIEEAYRAANAVGNVLATLLQG